MATGDVSLVIAPDGWSAYLSVAGFTSGATYAFGMAAYNIPGVSTPYIDVTSLGYDDTGAATTVTRRVYLQNVIRFPYSTASISGTFNSGAFQDGETVTQGTSGATAIVVGAQATGGLLIVRTVAGVPDNSHVWTGGTSGATFTASATPVTLTSPTNDEHVPTTGLTVRVALSDFVYAKDIAGAGFAANVSSGVAPVATIPANFVTNTAGAGQHSNALTGVAITNNSTQAYQKVVANWSWPGFWRITGSTFQLRVTAFERHAQSGRPVRCVKFTASDAHSHTAATTITALTYDATVGDAVPVVEYVGTMDATTLTALDLVTCNFIAYPWVGDSGSIMNSDLVANGGDGTAQPTPLVGPITLVNDKANTYGVTCALVDPTGSDAGANTVYDAGSFNPSAAYKFATISKAANAIKAYNLANHGAGRNDVGAGMIYLNDGAYAWAGSTNSNGSTNDTWLTVTRSSVSTSRAAVTISLAQTGNTSIASKLKVSDITVATSSSATFVSQPYLWFDQCTLSGTGTALVTGNCVKYVTRCSTTTVCNGLFRPTSQSLYRAPTAIIRGNTIAAYVESILTYTFLGNYSSATTFTMVDTISTMLDPFSSNTIVAFNKLMGNNNTALLNFRTITATSTGLAMVQNIFENKTKGPSAVCQIAATSTDVPTTANNVLLWHNVFMGQRENWAYNGFGTAATPRYFWSVKNNIISDTNVKSDTDNAFDARSGGRVGNWPMVFQVGCSGNVNSDSGNSFQPEFVGLNSVGTAWTPTNPNTLFQFTDYEAYNGTGTDGASGAGGGTYTLLQTSPAKGLQRDWVLAYDIAGNQRLATADAGAYAPSYATAGTRRSGRFFGPTFSKRSKLRRV